MISIVHSLDEIYTDTNTHLEKYEHIKNEFQNVFKAEPDFYVRAPGRVNLIGEHIDYEGYSVLPVAIAKEIILAVSIPTNSQHFMQLANIDNEQFPSRKIPMDPYTLIDKERHDWSQYFQCGYKGAWLLTGDEQEENLTGAPMNVLVSGNIPLASGLSSSSAFVVASTIASIYGAQQLCKNHGKLKSTNIANQKLDVASIAELCRIAEQYIGTLSGGMDQAISCFGIAKLIHFNPLRTENVKLPHNMVIVIADSLTKAEKAKSATTHYNKRVVECMLASKLIGLKLKLPTWKTVSLDIFLLKAPLLILGLIR